MTVDRRRAHFYYKPPPPPPPPAPGEAVFIGNNQAASRYQTFTVPAGITSISAVVVSYTSQYQSSTYNAAAYIACAIKRGGQTGTDLLSTSMALNANGVGGGNGGRRGADFDGNYSSSSAHASFLSGGGAAGYAGNGGNGGPGAMYGYTYGGGAGVGGAAAGGDGYAGNGSGGVAVGGVRGGGVGLFGQGNNGAPDPDPYSASPGVGGNGSVVQAPYVGAGAARCAGGDLRWKNNIPVTPGEVLTIDLGSSSRSDPVGAGCRIMYGDNRTFPSNAGNAVPQGQVIIKNVDTTYTIPAGVTSICIACQQSGDGVAVAVSTSTPTVLCRAQNGNRVGDGGGDGGLPGSSGDTNTGGGGCGRFTGNGGKGGGIVYTSTPGEWIGQEGTDGGGKGSSNVKDTGPVFGGQQAPWIYTAATPGLSIGIKTNNYDNVDGNYGGGSPGYSGGAISYKNNVTVTPGQVLTINSKGGRVRIIWGPGRTYPNTSGDI